MRKAKAIWQLKIQPQLFLNTIQLILALISKIGKPGNHRQRFNKENTMISTRLSCLSKQNLLFKHLLAKAECKAVLYEAVPPKDNNNNQQNILLLEVKNPLTKEPIIRLNLT
jgi:hypothetical protein